MTDKMYGVLLIVVLIITGGVIAFIGDRLGTKIGKKRLSIFGLRPRHTSIIVTIFTGVCITTLTFGVMAATSENVRTALFGMEKLHRDMVATQNSLDRVSNDLTLAQAEHETAVKGLEQSRNEIARLEQQQQELAAESERLQAGNLALEQAKAELLERNADLASRNEVLGGENAALTEHNNKLSLDNQELEKHAQDLRDGLISMREGDIAFQAGEVIASGVIRGGRGQEETAKDLGVLAQLANRNVSARLGENASDQEIWIYSPEYEAALSEIAHSQQDMVVRIVAAGNLIRGESVRAALELYPNSIIYKKDEFIIARVYQLDGNNGAIAEQTVMDFLKEVNHDATARGIIPDPIRKSVGVMDGEQFYEIVQALIPIQGSVILSAYARDDTDALGPLQLRMKMEELMDKSGRR